MATFKDLPVVPFETPAAWRAWLEAHATTSQGLWVQLYKKGSSIPTLTYAEALDEALCVGWIDSAKASWDEASFLQRFSPRRAGSLWSKRNREHVARLTEEGRMQPGGIAMVEEAKRNGQWEAAYDASGNAEVPEDFQLALDAHPGARAFFEGLGKTQRYAFLFRIQTVKRAETRAKKIAWAVGMLEAGRTVH